MPLVLFMILINYAKGYLRMNTLNKDQVLSNLVYTATTELNLSTYQSMDLMKIATKVFDSVDFLPRKNELSTERCNNELIIKNFCGCKRLSGVKDSTLRCYTQTYKTFLDYCKVSLLDVTTNDIRRFLLDYEQRNNKSTTDNARRNLNTLFQFMEDEDYIAKNPCKKIPKIKDDIKVKRFYNDFEMEKMRDACKTKRELALIDFLLATGTRVSEVSNIKLTDINWQDRSVLVTGKGNKQRIVRISQRCKKHLQEYIIERNGQSEYLFCSERAPYGNIKKASIEGILHTVGVRCGLPDITVHCFRRWFASDLFNKGVDIKIIQELLGHSNMQTTSEYYIKTNIDKIKIVYDTYAC